MAQQQGKELVIKRWNGTSFVFVCGVRTRSMTISNAQIDTTVPDCDDPSQPLVNTSVPGRQTITFSGDGLFDNADVGKAVADDARLQSLTDYQIIVPGYGTFEGEFMISDFEFGGEMEDQMTFSATWAPTGALAFTAEA